MLEPDESRSFQSGDSGVSRPFTAASIDTAALWREIPALNPSQSGSGADARSQFLTFSNPFETSNQGPRLQVADGSGRTLYGTGTLNDGGTGTNNSGDRRTPVGTNNSGDGRTPTADGGAERNAGTPNGAQDYSVRRGDSLWKIAERTLQSAGANTTPGAIWRQVENIIQANSREHPSLHRNPHDIRVGMNLKMPEGSGSPVRGEGDTVPLPPRRGESGTQYASVQRNSNNEGGSENVPLPRQRYSGYSFENAPIQPRGSGSEDVPLPPSRPRFNYGENSRGDNQQPRYRGLADGGDNQQPRNREGGDERPTSWRTRLTEATREALQLARSAERVASNLGTVGWCAKGVQIALHKMGLSEFLGSGNGVKTGRALANSGLFERVPMHEARRGDVIVRNWAPHVQAAKGRNDGDIVVVTGRDGSGRLRGANDHHGTIHPDGGRYRASYALRFRSNL